MDRTSGEREEKKSLWQKERDVSKGVHARGVPGANFLPRRVGKLLEGRPEGKTSRFGGC